MICQILFSKKKNIEKIFQMSSAEIFTQSAKESAKHYVKSF